MNEREDMDDPQKPDDDQTPAGSESAPPPQTTDVESSSGSIAEQPTQVSDEGPPVSSAAGESPLVPPPGSQPDTTALYTPQQDYGTQPPPYGTQPPYGAQPPGYGAPPPTHMMGQPPPPPEKKRSYLWVWIVAAVVVVAIIIALVVTLTRGNTVEVPDLSGLSLPETVAALSDADLRLGDVEYTSQIPSGFEEGQTVAQDPAPLAEVDANSTVDILVAGQAQLEIPDVLGLSIDEASQALEDLGFKVEVVESQDAADVGTVLDQSPEAGTLALPGSTVTLVVSGGQQETLVPRVVGMTQEEATATLEEAGYDVQAKATYDDQVDEGIVISQSPEAGTAAEPGSMVDIVVSQGENPAVEVPDVLDMTEARAVDTLEQTGLNPVPGWTYSETVPYGVVISQDPEAGSMAPRGSNVAFSLSAGVAPPESATVPNVVGQPENEAVSTLEAAGYQTAVTRSYSDVVPVDLVGAQAPMGGNITEPGITVVLLVSDGPRPDDDFVLVPDFKEMTLEEATAAADEAGLEVLAVDFYTGLAPEGQVAAQLPPADSSVAPGSTILLLISRGPQPEVNPQ